MKKFMSLTFGFFFCLSLSAQNGNRPVEPGISITIPEQDSSNQTFMMVEQMPVFTGSAQKSKKYVYSGDQRAEEENSNEMLSHYLAQNISYPKTAKEKGAQGKVFVQFIIEKDGRVSNVEIIRGVHPDIDKEAIRVISSMPNWVPGYQKGKPARVVYRIPLNFTLR
jgi:periplasmic protein TonB